jgi:2-haloacid dehalogenase
MMPSSRARIVVFDLGGVLFDWDPRHLYRKIFDDPVLMEWFLREVCTPAWNLEQDRGRTWAEAVAERIALYPDYADAIRAFDERWIETISQPIQGNVALLETLRSKGIPTYALTNCSAEKFEVLCGAFPFLKAFDGAIVSGAEHLLKPDPAIYRLLLDRYRLKAADCFFIDDVAKNVDAARAVGIYAHHFTGVAGLTQDLRDHGFPV